MFSINPDDHHLGSMIGHGDLKGKPTIAKGTRQAVLRTIVTVKRTRETPSGSILMKKSLRGGQVGGMAVQVENGGRGSIPEACSLKSAQPQGPGKVGHNNKTRGEE